MIGRSDFAHHVFLERGLGLLSFATKRLVWEGASHIWRQWKCFNSQRICISLKLLEKLHISLRLQSDQLILLESAMCCPIIGSKSIMVVGYVGAKSVVGFMEVEFVVVHMSIDVHVLTKFGDSTKTGSLQLYLLWSVLGPQA